MDVIAKIEQLRKERGWTVYRLAMESGVTQSTLATMYQRKTPPKFEILQSLCSAFGITLAQFFFEGEEMEIVSAAEKRLLNAYRSVSKEKQEAVFELLK